MSCTLDSINASLATSPYLQPLLATSLALVLRANSTHSKDIHIKTFTTIQALFSRLPSETSFDDPEIKKSLESLFFDPRYEGLPEAMRLKRAEALVAVTKVKGCEWVVEKVKPEVEGGERSAVVRGVLSKVGKE